METDTAPDLAKQYAAALDWWREAGVDHHFRDDAEALLQEPKSPQERVAVRQAEKQKPVEETPKAPPMGGERSAWPETLEAFHSWWMNEPSLDAGATRGRVLPRGTAGAELMILVPMPEAGDGESLLSGPHGKLVSNMLRAMKIAEEKAYLASALPRHMPLADWEGLAVAGLGDVLQHHIALARPSRLLVLGRDLMPLLGVEKRQGVAELSLDDSSIQLLASFAPENLLENARLRARLWHGWLDWTGKV